MNETTNESPTAILWRQIGVTLLIVVIAFPVIGGLLLFAIPVTNLNVTYEAACLIICVLHIVSFLSVTSKHFGVASVLGLVITFILLSYKSTSVLIDTDEGPLWQELMGISHRSYGLLGWLRVFDFPDAKLGRFYVDAIALAITIELSIATTSIAFLCLGRWLPQNTEPWALNENREA